MKPHEFNLLNPIQLADSHLFPSLAELHANEPVFWSNAMHGWVLGSHHAVTTALKDQRISNKRVAEFAFRAIPRDEWANTIPNLFRGVENWVVDMDGPRHRRVRSLLMKAFSRQYVESLQPLVSQYCEHAVEKAVAAGEFDFMREIVFPVPARIILNILGLPEEHLDKVNDWNQRINRTVQTAADRDVLLDGDRAIAEMNSFVRGEIEARRQAPKDDFLTKLVNATEDGDRLNLDELFSACQVLLIAGQDTTVNSICLGTLAFLRHPRQLWRFLDETIDPMTAMNEVTRYTSMATCLYKVAAQDFELEGKHIRPGDIVYIMIAAGNRDPHVFRDPDRLDLGRENLDKIVTFGPGIHRCIGHYLARMEMATFFRLFFSRIRNIEVLDDPVEFQPNFVFRGLKHLHMRVST